MLSLRDWIYFSSWEGARESLGLSLREEVGVKAVYESHLWEAAGIQ